MSLFVFVVVAALMIVLACSAWHFRGGASEPEKPVWYCRCPGCRQKLRYRHSRGRRALCPRCLRVFVLPANAPASSGKSTVAGPS